MPKVGTDVEQLKQAICDGIRWADIPWRTSPLLFKRLKEEIVRLKDEGRVLMRFNELRETLHLRMLEQQSEDVQRFGDDELKAVVGLLAGPGAVWELAFGGWVLLQPEVINAYAQAVIQTMRADPHERGCILEERVLNGDLTYHSSMKRLAGDDERFVLLAMHQMLLERGVCLREQTDEGPMLVFPSLYRRERPDLVGHPAVLVGYQFNGFLDDVYATLVVRLHHTKWYDQDQIWLNAADFKTQTGRQLGVKLTRRAEGAGEIEVYFDSAISASEKIVFSKFVYDHLLQKARDVERLRHYVCPHCGTTVGNREVAMRRLEAWRQDAETEQAGGALGRLGRRKPKEPTILCADCEKRVPLWDEMEQRFVGDEARRQVRELEQQTAAELERESRERALVADVIATSTLAGQLCRELGVSQRGIDMEIEFLDDACQPTGELVYLIAKSAGAYQRQQGRDDAGTFAIADQAQARFWMRQAFPVVLVIRNERGEVRWMDVREPLRKASNDGRTPVQRIAFIGERLDVMSVRRWRQQALGLEAP